MLRLIDTIECMTDQDAADLDGVVFTSWVSTEQREAGRRVKPLYAELLVVWKDLAAAGVIKVQTAWSADTANQTPVQAFTASQKLYAKLHGSASAVQTELTLLTGASPASGQATCLILDLVDSTYQHLAGLPQNIAARLENDATDYTAGTVSVFMKLWG